jgi:hypothetical protein
MLFISLAVSAGATTITIESATSVANAYADENAWILANFGSNFDANILANFENFSASNSTGYTSLATGAGTFSVMPGSQPGSPVWSTGTKQNQFIIIDSADSKFSGRYNTTPGGNNWLDSNDITQLQLATSLNTVFFMMTDVNDVGGTLTIKTADGTQSSGFAQHAPNGNLYFVAITSANPLGYIDFLNSSNYDGYGIDDVGTPVDPPPPTPTPEPGTLSVAGFGLAAIALIRKFKAARSGASV